MLPAAARLRRRRDFSATLRSGRRATRSTLMVSLARAGADTNTTDFDAGLLPRVGFAVGRGVGGSVTRHLITRRLRHLMADRLDRLAPGDRLVVRARPGAATADFAHLGRDLDAALDRLLGAAR